MVHDRRIDDQSQLFGNAGTLYMNAMTWYDHETHSIWSQPWGRAIRGPLLGVELFLLPSQLSSWASWRAEHPHTLVAVNDIERFSHFPPQRFRANFVIGLVLGATARAYPYETVAAAVVVNDELDGVPVMIWAADDSFYAYLRQVGGQTLTFRSENGVLLDNETGSTWYPARGLAVDGPRRGQGLQPIPSLTAFDWAWFDFYPDSDLYAPETPP
jgi:hypothetical protein